MKHNILTCLCLLIGLSGIAQETGALTVEVVNEEEMPLGFATVLLFQGDIVIFGAHTDPEGKAHLRSLPAGQYELGIRFAGDKSEQEMIQIVPGNTLITKVEVKITKTICSEWREYENLYPNDWSGQTWNSDDIRRSPFR